MNLGRQSSTPPVVMNLIIANAVIFLASMLYETSMVGFGLFNFDLRAGAYEVWNNFINFNFINFILNCNLNLYCFRNFRRIIGL